MARGQSVELYGSAGPTITDTGHSVAAGVGVSPTSRFTLFVSIERTHLSGQIRREAGSASYFRGGTYLLGSAELRFIPLAEATGLPLQHIDEALGAAHASISLNQTVGADDEGELGDLFADREAADPFDEAEESLRRQGIRRALDALPERERRILELRFGFEGEPWTLEAIGNELELTRERVRQLESQALARLSALRELQTVAAA